MRAAQVGQILFCICSKTGWRRWKDDGRDAGSIGWPKRSEGSGPCYLEFPRPMGNIVLTSGGLCEQQKKKGYDSFDRCWSAYLFFKRIVPRLKGAFYLLFAESRSGPSLLRRRRVSRVICPPFSQSRRFTPVIAIVLMGSVFNKIDSLSIEFFFFFYSFGPVRRQSCRQPREKCLTGSCPCVIRVDLGTGGRNRKR